MFEKKFIYFQKSVDDFYNIAESKDADDGNKNELLGNVEKTTLQDLKNMAEKNFNAIENSLKNLLDEKDKKEIKQNIADIFYCCERKIFDEEKLENEKIIEIIEKLNFDFENLVAENSREKYEKNLVEYFDLSEEYQKIKESLKSPFNFSIIQTLKNYENYIENNLQISKKNKLTQNERKNLISNVKIFIK